MQIVGREPFKKKMALAPNWEDQDTATCIIINYFADRHHTEKILKKQECLTAETCSYCKECKNCTKLKTYREEFKKKKKGFWTFNKNVRYWNVYNPDWSYRNDFFFIKTFKKVYLEISIVKLSFNLKIM